MQLNLTNYSFHESNGQFYIKVNRADSPQTSSPVETLQKIERYLFNNWEYSTDPKIVAEHPCPWTKDSVRGQLGRYAEELNNNFRLQKRSLTERAKKYIQGEDQQVATLFSQITAHLQLSDKDFKERKDHVLYLANHLGWDEHRGDPQAYVLGFKEFLEDLIAQGIFPSSCNFYGKTKRSIYEPRWLPTVLKTIYSVFGGLDIGFWQESKWHDNVSKLLDKYIQAEDKFKIFYLGLIYPLVHLKDVCLLERITRAEKFKLLNDLIDSKFKMIMHFSNHVGSPLKLILQKGHDDLAKDLIASGYDLNMKDKQGNNLLMYLLSLEEFEDFVPLDTSDKTDNSVILKLIKLGIDINTRNRQHQSPLELARLHDNPEVELKLLLAGASSEARKSTLLHQACKEKNFPLARFLINEGARVNEQDIDGQSPLHLAVSSPDIVALLMANGADLNKETRDRETPIHYAISSDSPSLDLMLDCVTDEKNYLSISIQMGRTSVVKKLIDFGFSVIPVDFTQAVANYHVSQTPYRFEIIRLILESGVDLRLTILPVVHTYNFLYGLADPKVASLVKSHTQNDKLL